MLQHWNGGPVHHPIAPQQPLPLTPVPVCSLPRCLSPATRRPIRRIATGRCRVITWRCLSKPPQRADAVLCPGLGEPDEALLPWLQKADCLLIDGTVWQDDELQAAGVGRNTGRDMATRGDEHGMMALLASCRQNAKFSFILITPTRSLTAASANATGIEVSWDGWQSPFRIPHADH